MYSPIVRPFEFSELQTKPNDAIYGDGSFELLIERGS